MAYDSFLKEARKSSPDPKQEHLREHKATWNKSTSALIAKIIAFKRAINGKGDARFQLPASSIKSPLPNGVGEFLNNLANEFEKVSKEAESIMHEQAEYAKTRRKSKKEVDLSGGGPDPLAGLALSASDRNSFLVSESSSRIGRLFSKVKISLSPEPNKYIRRDLLKITAELYYEFLNFQNIVVSSGTTKEMIVIEQQKLKNNFDSWVNHCVHAIKRANKAAAQLQAKSPETQDPTIPEQSSSESINESSVEKPVEQDTSVPANKPQILVNPVINNDNQVSAPIEKDLKKADLPEAVKPEIEEQEKVPAITSMALAYKYFKKIQEEYISAYYLTQDVKPEPEDREKLRSKLNEIKVFEDDNKDFFKNKKSDNYKVISETFYSLVTDAVQLCSNLREFLITYLNLNPDDAEKLSIKDMHDLMHKKNAAINHQIVVNAHNFVSRWLKKLRHKLPFASELSGTIIDLFEEVNVIKVALDSVMNNIQDNASFEGQLESSLKTIQKHMNNITELVSLVDKDYTSEMLSEDNMDALSKRKQHNQAIRYLNQTSQKPEEIKAEIVEPVKPKEEPKKPEQKK